MLRAVRSNPDKPPRPAGERAAEAEGLRRIWAVVQRIPRGSVATYGQVAAEAGLPRRARLAGRALQLTPVDLDIPWHRVLNAQGRISLPSGSRGAREQHRRLREEGVEFVRGRVSLPRFRWHPRSDAPVLD